MALAFGGGLLAIALVVTGALPAQATYYSGGVGSTYFSVRIYGVNPTWVGFFQAGISAWNATNGSTGVIIGQNTTSPRTLTAGNYSTSWLGLYTPAGTRANRTFQIQANATTISQTTGSTVTNWAKFTATHELGHALSLADNPSTSSTSIMKYIPASGTPYISPRPYDIQNVIDYY